MTSQQYQLPNSDGSTWQDIDLNNLSLSVTPTVASTAILSANVDLWTANSALNQDVGIWVASADPNQYPGNIVAWKESGGFAGTFSPNAAFVETAYPMTAGVTYNVRLRWKTNRSAIGATIAAGAGPWSSHFSPSRLSVKLVAPAVVQSALSNSQYQLANSDGTNWQDIDGATLAKNVTPSADSTTILSANTDLWTANAGFNQDVGIYVLEADPSLYPGHIVAWKESGGFAGTFSPNAAFVQADFPMTAGLTYHVRLQWKTNKNASGATILAGAGPLPGGGSLFSPTRLTVQVVPNTDPSRPQEARSARQYALPNGDGNTWVDMDSSRLKLTVTAGASGTAILSANSDLWTANAGFNQDIGIYIDQADTTTYPGHIVAWKESGGFAGIFSPNAAFLQVSYPVVSGTTYNITIQWKTNKPANGATMLAGAGPWPAGSTNSPTTLSYQLVQ